MGRVLWLNSRSVEVLNAWGQVADRSAAKWRKGVPKAQQDAAQSDADEAWERNWQWYEEHRKEWEGDGE